MNKKTTITIVVIIAIFAFVTGLFMMFKNNQTKNELNDKNIITESNDDKSNNENDIKKQQIEEKKNEAQQENNVTKIESQSLPKNANDIYAKQYAKYQTDYDSNAMYYIKLLSNIFIYEIEDLNKLTNQELLQLAFDIYLQKNIEDGSAKGNSVGLTEEITSGTKKISLDEINEILNKYYGKQAKGEDVYSFFFVESTNEKLFVYDDKDKSFMFNPDLGGHGIIDLNVYSRYLSSSLNNNVLTINVANVYSAPQFYDTDFYYSYKAVKNTYKAVKNEDNKLITIEYTEEKIYDKLYEELYNLSLDKLQQVTYTFDISNNTYKLLSIHIN